MLKKIGSDRKSAENSQKSQKFLAFFILGTLALSTFGYALFSASDSTQAQKYNGKRFTLTENGWQGEGLNFATYYLPQEVDMIPFSGSRPSLQDFNTKVYFVTATSNTPAIEWANTVPMQTFQLACLPEEADKSGCEDLPLKSCADANYQSAVIIFRNANETSATYSPYCLTIYGDDSGATRAVDKAVYLMNGVIA